MRHSHKRALGLFWVLGSLLLPSVGQAQTIDVQAGYDLFVTVSADFMGQPFKGLPIGNFDFGGSIGVKNVGNTDTIVQRGPAEFGVPTAIQMVDLSLISVNPIAGNMGGTVGDYVKAVLDHSLSSDITINADHTFSSHLNFVVDLIDAGTNALLLTQQINFTQSGSHWSPTPVGALDIPLIPGINYQTPGQGSDFFLVGTATHTTPNGDDIHVVKQAPEPTTLSIFALGAGLLGFRRRKAA